MLFWDDLNFIRKLTFLFEAFFFLLTFRKKMCLTCKCKYSQCKFFWWTGVDLTVFRTSEERPLHNKFYQLFKASTKKVYSKPFDPLTLKRNVWSSFEYLLWRVSVLTDRHKPLYTLRVHIDINFDSFEFQEMCVRTSSSLTRLVVWCTFSSTLSLQSEFVFRDKTYVREVDPLCVRAYILQVPSLKHYPRTNTILYFVS